METPFTFNTPVTGKKFFGRSDNLTEMDRLLSQCRNVLIFDGPKTGKTSLIRQTFFLMKARNVIFNVAEISLVNIRTVADFITKLVTKILETTFSTEDELRDAAGKYLSGTHIEFDCILRSGFGPSFKINGNIDENDLKTVVTLPHRLASDIGKRIYVVIDEFQNLMQTEDGEWVLLAFEEALDALMENLKGWSSYIFCGSCVNAMKEIFVHKKMFSSQVTRCILEPFVRKDVIEFVIKGFLSGGKVADRDMVTNVCNVLRNDIWHLTLFCSICDSKAKGYVMEQVFLESLNEMISLFEPQYKAIMNDLTTYQIFLLKAIMDGNTKFSSAEVIRHYNLNSSANVRRLKDALCKKEIVTFNEKDEPHIIDPLFEYWVSKYYFQMV